MKAINAQRIAPGLVLALAAALLPAGAHAQAAPEALSQAADHAAHHAAAAGSPQSEGEVRKVDLEQGKVTLRHGPLVNLDMPAMTMVFRASDPKLLDGVKQGDKVRFTADKQDGGYIVTALEVVTQP